MAFNYPYGDTQQLNLDWIITKIKELEESGLGLNLEEVSVALIALKYNTSTTYAVYDYAFYNGKLYRCLSSTSGAFNPAAWQEALIGDDVAILTRWINALDAAAVVDVKYDTSGTNGKIQQKYNDAYHDVVEVDYTPVQNSKRPLSSNAGYALNNAINGKMDVNPTKIELIPPTTWTNGGFIDFHYAGDASDYTARIIEQPQGNLKVYGTLDLQTPLSVSSGGTGFNSVDTVPTQNSNKMITSGGVYDALKLYSTLTSIDTSFGNTISVTARRTGLVAQLNSAVLQNSPIQYTSAGWKTICTVPTEFQVTQQMRFGLINFSTGEIYQARLTEKTFQAPNLVQVYIDTPNINTNFLPSFTFLYLLD